MQDRQNNANQLPNVFEQAEIFAWFIHLIAGALGAMTVPFTRRYIGTKYLGLRGFVGLMIFWFYSIAVSPADTSLYAFATFVWFFMAFWSVAGRNAELFGQSIHSQYSGWPRIADWLSVKELTAKGVLEPLLSIAVGLLISNFADKAFGIFVIVSGIGSWLDFAIIQDRQMKKLSQMRDAEIESDMMWDAYENRYGRK